MADDRQPSTEAHADRTTTPDRPDGSSVRPHEPGLSPTWPLPLLPEQPADRRPRMVALVSLAVGVAMFLGKWFAYGVTGSHAILSDALESVVHVIATGFAFTSIVLAARPPDTTYPYGYGKIAYFSAGFEGGLIALAALAIVFKAVQGLIFGAELAHLDLGLGVIVAASVVNLALGLWLIREGRHANSLILVADGQHVLTDSYTSFGVIVGLSLVLATGWTWLDSAVAIALGLNILWTGYGLVRAAFSGLMDRADPDLLARIVAALNAVRQPGWIDLHQLRAWQAGDRVFVDFHLVVPDHWTVKQLHHTNDLVREALKHGLGPRVEVLIHFDSHDPTRFNEQHAWTVAHAVRVPSPTPADATSREIGSFASPGPASTGT